MYTTLNVRELLVYFKIFILKLQIKHEINYL